MRVLLHQSAKGLFSPSGGYRTNLTLLKYLASQGHTVQQILCAYEKEIQDYVEEEKARGRKCSLMKYQLQVPTAKGSAPLNVFHFTLREGIKVVALSANQFQALLSDEDLHKYTRAFLEVHIVIRGETCSMLKRL